MQSFLINYDISSTVMLGVGGSGSLGTDKLEKEIVLFVNWKPYKGAGWLCLESWSNLTSQNWL